jgi:hypothetical protein
VVAVGLGAFGMGPPFRSELVPGSPPDDGADSTGPRLPSAALRWRQAPRGIASAAGDHAPRAPSRSWPSAVITWSESNALVQRFCQPARNCSRDRPIAD